MSRNHVAHSSSMSPLTEFPDAQVNMDDSPSSLAQQLEAKISKLKDALHYWKTWEAEYEGLKEELEGAEELTAPEMVRKKISPDSR
jgi:hypothetical protein